MERYIKKELIKWKNSQTRKPLIIKGARQVGKTYVLKEFGLEEYENFVYFNFDHDDSLKNVFINTKDPSKILRDLTFISNDVIKPEKTLIIFDEIQECPDALNALKYFHEEKNEYHIACAGSLLGIKLAKTSFPVGQVEFLEMFPMTFSEFLLAEGSNKYVEYMESIDKIEMISQYMHDELNDKLKSYFIIGGMPEVVDAWCKTRDMKLVNKIQKDILLGYENDFGKHQETANIIAKISIIWESIISQLSRDNKKFLYQTAKDGARARDYEDAVNWLNNSNIVNKIYNINKPDFPLCAYNDLSSFKLYLSDIGLLRQKANLDSKIISEGNKLFEEFKGALTENYILNMLIYRFNDRPNYYTFDRHEIDFIMQYNNEIIPIEVKSSENIKNISLSKFNDNNNNKISIRFSTRNLNMNEKIINIPLYLAEYTDKILDIVIK